MPAALGEEGVGALVGDDLEVVGVTGLEEVDGSSGPHAEDDGPLDLPHGDVLRVILPVIADCVELVLEFMGERDEEGGEVCGGASDGARLIAEDILDFAPE